MIDAGHGGKDVGAVSKDKKTYEKTLTLDIAQRFADQVRRDCPDVKVVLTRDSDVFVPLGDRAAKANKAGAQLFISIHINSTTGTAANGYSVHVLGQSSVKNRDLFAYNMDVCRRENSVILLEEDYSTKYQGFDPTDPESFIFMQLMQNAYLEQSLLLSSVICGKLKGGPVKADRGIWQNPFYVLWKTAMPAVLVELGFISNSEDLAALRDEKNRDDLAKRLGEAFVVYKTLYDSSVNVQGMQNVVSEAAVAPAIAEPAPAQPEANPSPATPVAAESKPAPEAPAAVAPKRYGTQIFAASRDIDPGDKLFLGYTPKVIRIGSLRKYIIGIFEDPAQARAANAEIKKTYPSCFMVCLEGENVSRFK